MDEPGALRAQTRVAQNRAHLPKQYSWMAAAAPPPNAVRSSQRFYVIRSDSGEIGKVFGALALRAAMRARPRITLLTHAIALLGTAPA
eukprot:5984420-Prymnesium_polylepis.2